MGETEISWTHRPGTVGRSWNPVQGCRRVSEGCRNCYAERLAARFAESGWSQGLIDLKTRKWNGEARLAAHKLAEPLTWRKPATVFTNSMSDLFYEGFTNEQIAAVFGVMAAAPQHTFQILTKRAKRMREWFEWIASTWPSLEPMHATVGPDANVALAHLPNDSRFQIEGKTYGESFAPAWPLPNVWIGVSVENQDAADERIPELLETPAAVRFLSCEPLLGPVDLDAIQIPEERAGLRFSALRRQHDSQFGSSDTVIDWAIIGCESGPRARPCSIAWLRSLRNQCSEAGVPIFLKQAKLENESCEDCGEQLRYHAHSPTLCDVWCGCTHEGPETSNSPPIAMGEGSREKAGRVVELPYLDGKQWAQFPEASHAT